MCAAPAYLEAHGTPQTPQDLVRHNCFVLGSNWQWCFTRGKEDFSVRVSGKLRSNNGEMLRHAALDGHGLIQISELRVRGDLASGRLVQVLQDYDVAGNSAVWAVYPSSKHVLPKLRVLLDFLANWFREFYEEWPRAAKRSGNGGRSHGAAKPIPQTTAIPARQPGALLP